MVDDDEARRVASLLPTADATTLRSWAARLLEGRRDRIAQQVRLVRQLHHHRQRMQQASRHLDHDDPDQAELDRLRAGCYSRYQVPERRVTRMPKGRVHELRYLVEIPIPYVDRRGRALDRRKRSKWQRRIGEVLTECFGGFTPAKAPAMNRVQAAGGGWMVLTEKGQVVLRSACADRDTFLSHRDRLVDRVESMGEDLDQADVFILAYASDSLLIEVTERIH